MQAALAHCWCNGAAVHVQYTLQDATNDLGCRVLLAVPFHTTVVSTNTAWLRAVNAYNLASANIPSKVIECGFAGSRFCTACTGYHCLVQSSTSGVTFGIVSGGVVFVAPSCSKQQLVSIGKYVDDCAGQ